MTDVRELFKAWHKDPEYVREYEALEEEFSLATAIVAARAHAGLTQAELAQRMGTTQSVIARLESGRAKPSTATLGKVAKATGTPGLESISSPGRIVVHLRVAPTLVSPSAIGRKSVLRGLIAKQLFADTGSSKPQMPLIA